MSQSSKLDEAVANAESEAIRQSKKSCVPKDNSGDNYVDPVGDSMKYSEAGKGGKYRSIEGWYSEEMTKKMEKIFGGKKEKKAKANKKK